MSDSFDLVVVGAGIIGLATARELQLRRPGAKLAVLDKEAVVGAHQTGHSSGVVHRGVYYTPGSLKARLCVEGAEQLLRYCDERGIPILHCGKVVVATTSEELPRLDELYRRSAANGVPRVELIGPERLGELEPNVAGVRALHSPETVVVDFGLVAEAYADDIRRRRGRDPARLRRRRLRQARRRDRRAHRYGRDRPRPVSSSAPGCTPTALRPSPARPRSRASSRSGATTCGSSRSDAASYGDSCTPCRIRRSPFSASTRPCGRTVTCGSAPTPCSRSPGRGTAGGTSPFATSARRGARPRSVASPGGTGASGRAKRCATSRPGASSRPPAS